MGRKSESAAHEPFGPARSERLSQQIHESLFHAIVTGKIARGQRLPSEHELTSQFRVSRPIVREALDRLRREGLVESFRGSGSYVKDSGGLAATVPDGDSLQRTSALLHGLEFRLVVETEAAFLAAQRRDPADLDRMAAAIEGFRKAVESGAVAQHFDFAFHQAVGLATANPRFAAALNSLEHDVSHAVSLMRHLGRLEPLDRAQAVLREHREIHAAIEAGDGEAARRAMRHHLEHARIRMLTSRPKV